MPFTFSHPAAILPLNYFPKKWISLTALVIGSMTPDFEYFIRMKVEAKYSHTWAGLFWFDLPLGLLLMLLYNALVKDKLIDQLPAYFNKRLSILKSPGAPYFKQHFIIIMLCIVIGAASHILWDSFTHPGAYFVTHIHQLNHHVYIGHYVFPLYNALQHLSTFTGAAIILYSITQLSVGQLTKHNSIAAYWIKVIGVAMLVLVIRVLAGLKPQAYADVIVSAISGMLIGLVLTSVITPAKQII